MVICPFRGQSRNAHYLTIRHMGRLEPFYVIGYHPSAQVIPQAQGVADVTTENHRPLPPGGSLGAAAARPVRAEPSWGRVLLTTVELWLSRRLQAVGRGRRGRGRLAGAVVAVAVAVAALAVWQFTGVFSATAPRTAAPAVSKPAATPDAAARAAASAQTAAVAWMAGQVSSAAMIGCYPALCAALQAQGTSAGRLVPLGANMTGLLTTDVIATRPAADPGLVAQYAPAVIASFGSGAARIEIRAVAPAGAAAYRSALRADLQARKSAGAQLLRNSRIRFSAADATRIRAGQVDSRLLATLAALSSQFPLRVLAFADSSPGAPLLFREMTVVRDGAGNGRAALTAALAMVNAQEGPYRPARSAIVGSGPGPDALDIQFPAPNPLGLLTAVLTADRQQKRGRDD
jgi:hypothetical protein